jgi:signal transduction histidine kinase
MALTRAPAPLTGVSLDDITRYRSVLVFVALPVWSGGTLAGVVRMSARSSGPLEAAWDHRGTVAIALLACFLFMLGLTYFLSRVISRPVQQLTSAAEAVARGESLPPAATAHLAPAELRSLRNAVGRMTEQLTDRAEYIAGFATTVSHELKTPITSIRGAIELLRDDWASMTEEQRRRFLDNVDADTQRMERLVARLLQLARIQSAPEAAESIDVQQFFGRLGERYGPAVRVRFNGAPERLTMNPDHLETAIHNLIDNAVRHGRGQPVDVVIGRGADGRVSVSVRDYGSGISDGNRARIFDRFFTTERDHGGTGLGLAIVQAVAQTRGGAVTFDTSPNGSTFVLTV